MVKKDFQRTASAIERNTSALHPGYIHKDGLVNSLVDYFKYEYPKFDEAKFRMACGEKVVV